MMSDLHWTGAALLLAVATLGGSARARQASEVSWDEFARECGIGADGPATARSADPRAAAAPTPELGGAAGGSVPLAAERSAGAAPAGGAPAAARAATGRGPGTAPVELGAYRPAAPRGQTAGLRATATCGHCGRAAGELEWDAPTPTRQAILRPADGAPPRVVPLGGRLRCPHCGGPVFVEEPEPIVVRAPVTLAPARRGRPRKAAQRAS